MIATAVCNTYIELGVNAYKQGLDDIGEKMLDAAFEEAQRLSRKDAPPCSVFNTLARLYYSQQNFEKAEFVYQQAIAVYERIFEDHDATLAGMMLNLAELYFSRGKYAEAENLYERALQFDNGDLTYRAFGAERCMMKLAWIYCHHKRFDEAHKIYKRVQELRELKSCKDTAVGA